MFRQILVPVDGSSLAEQSIPWAARIARASRASLVLLRVVASPLAGVLYESQESTSSTAMLQARQAQAVSYLQTLAQRHDLEGLSVIPAVSSGQLATDEILSAARTHGADLIVLSTHLHTYRTRWLQASVAQNIVRLADAPVLVVHEQALADSAEATALLPPDHVRVLATLDGSPCAEGVLGPATELALALAGASRAQLHLLRVLEPTGQIGAANPSMDDQARQAAMREYAVDEANAYLEGIAARVQDDSRGVNVEITWSVVVANDPVEVILRETEECFNARDSVTGGHAPTSQAVFLSKLVAMTTHGAGGIRPWSLGSVSDRMLHVSAAPLLIARPYAI